MARINFQLLATEKLGPADEHVVRVEVTDPTGENRSFYRYCTTARAGKGVALIPLAENDPVGQWKVALTDVSTGTTQQVTISVAK